MFSAKVLRMLGLASDKTPSPQKAATLPGWLPSPFKWVVTFLVLVFIFMDDETLLKLVGRETKESVKEYDWPKTPKPKWAEPEEKTEKALERPRGKDAQMPERKRKPPPPPKPALTSPKEVIMDHIESLQKIRNISGQDNGTMRDNGDTKVFADQYLTSLVNDDLRPIPMSKMHSNRLVLNPDIAKIPNVVHLIQFNKFNYDNSDYFTFARYVTFKSVERYLKPGLILFWGDHIPWGSKWWNRTLAEVPNIYYVFAPPVYELGKEIVEFIQHKSDWLRLDFLHKYGGIFLDNDVIVLRPFSDLMDYTVLMGRETTDSVATGVILCRKGSNFMSVWKKVYEQYKPTVYNLNSNLVVSNLAKTDIERRRPRFLIDVLPGNFTNPYPPRSNEKYILYCGHYNLRYNYAVHMYQEKKHTVPRDLKELESYNCTLGDAMRIALYGDPKLLDTKNAKSGCHPPK